MVKLQAEISGVTEQLLMLQYARRNCFMIQLTVTVVPFFCFSLLVEDSFRCRSLMPTEAQRWHTPFTPGTAEPSQGVGALTSAAQTGACYGLSRATCVLCERSFRAEIIRQRVVRVWRKTGWFSRGGKICGVVG